MAIQRLQITYAELPIVAERKATLSSGQEITVDLSGILESLLVFYDQVWLPYPYGFVRDGPVLWGVEIPRAQADQFLRSMDLMYSAYEQWSSEWKPLFDEGLLHVLPPPIRNLTEIPTGFADAIRNGLANEDSEISVFPLISGEFALTIHRMYGEKQAPELIPAHPANALEAVLTHSLFQYAVPRLGAINPEQVLELRTDLGDVRQGFQDYVFQLLDDVEGRMKNGLSPWDAADVTVKRKILPEYDEMRRQMAAKNTGKWSKLLGGLSDFMLIDASPWTPKFYGQFFKTFFGTTEKAAQAEEEARKNSGQAFQLIARLESNAAQAGVGRL
jgi:hypothetical protein